MTKTPLLSVVIPLYNKERSVERAIRSVLRQTFENFELIVIDDGSTDGSRKVVDGFSDKRLTLISQPNSGVSAARNAGVQNGQAQFIAFLDADDEWHPEFLERIWDLIQADPTAGLFSCRYEMVDPRGRRGLGKLSLSSNHQGLVPDFYSHYRKSRSLINSSAVCVNRTAFYAVGGFPQGEPVGEDVFVWLSLAKMWRVNFDARVSVICYQDAENRTVDRLPPTIPYYLRAFLKVKQHDRSLRKLLASYSIIYAAAAVERGHPEKAKQYGRLLRLNDRVNALLCYAIAYVPPFVFKHVKQYRHNMRHIRSNGRTA